MNLIRTLFRATAVASLVAPSSSMKAPPPLEFAPADMVEWDEHSFAGETQYGLVEIEGRTAVHASCEGRNASGLYHRYEVDLDTTPVMEWRWRVHETLSGVDETTKEGDDYPARVYVIEERSILRWRSRALNYVWASEQEVGSSWPNAHNSRAHMVAVRSGPSDESGTWHTERRNVQRDFQRYHDRRPRHITHVAIMTDCDNTGERLEGWYGTIRFLPG